MRQLTNYEIIAIYRLCEKDIKRIQKRGELVSIKIFKRMLSSGKAIKFFVCFNFLDKKTNTIHSNASDYLNLYTVIENMFNNQDEEGYEFTDKLLNKAILEEDYY